ncbi:GNAT family N-acetyltransferase [Hymenobacter sp. APR13]|uniref:GNAT family N-acetyltransferase n=1 Tax=Hymenobacter sp. APR13 TaxID=1356852 RepID=UPI00397735DD
MPLTAWQWAVLGCISRATCAAARPKSATGWRGRTGGGGLATAAVQAVAAYVLANFDVCRLYAVVFEPNAASARVLEKAGFALEATMRKSVVKDGQMLDSRLYALVV